MPSHPCDGRLQSRLASHQAAAPPPLSTYLVRTWILRLLNITFITGRRVDKVFHPQQACSSNDTNELDADGDICLPVKDVLMPGLLVCDVYKLIIGLIVSRICIAGGTGCIPGSFRIGGRSVANLPQTVVSCTGTRLTVRTGTGNRFSVRFFDK